MSSIIGKRIVVLGCSGSGKSTLAKALGCIAKLPVIHLDAQFWNAGWVKTPHEQWLAKESQLAAGDEWIMDGNYSNTLQVRLARADTAIFLDYPRIVCLLGVLKRWLANVGRTRADMAPGCPEKLDWEFIQWVWNFNKRSRRQTLGALAGFNGRVYVFKSRRQTACFLKELSRRD